MAFGIGEAKTQAINSTVSAGASTAPTEEAKMAGSGLEEKAEAKRRLMESLRSLTAEERREVALILRREDFVTKSGSPTFVSFAAHSSSSSSSSTPAVEEGKEELKVETLVFPKLTSEFEFKSPDYAYCTSEEQLRIAAQAGDIRMINKLLKAGVRVAKIYSPDKLALLRMIGRPHLLAMKWLLQEGNDLVRSIDGNSINKVLWPWLGILLPQLFKDLLLNSTVRHKTVWGLQWLLRKVSVENAEIGLHNLLISIAKYCPGYQLWNHTSGYQVWNQNGINIWNPTTFDSKNTQGGLLDSWNQDRLMKAEREVALMRRKALADSSGQVTGTILSPILTGFSNGTVWLLRKAIEAGGIARANL